jgi:alkylated DNA repair dioxygenase AlkB
MKQANPYKYIEINLPDANIRLFPHFLNPDMAAQLFQVFSNKVPWRHDPIKVFGKTYMQPRLTSLHGTTNQGYGYANIRMQAQPMMPELNDILQRIAKIDNSDFNIVLLNLYRDGNDSNGWHADNEKELGQNPVIASVSLGAPRLFKLKHRYDKNLKHQLLLESGSLLLMSGATQHYWLHQVPKTKKQVGPRINLTFRKVLDSA